MADISTTIAGVKLKTCVFNASGPKDETLEDLHIIAKSKSSAVMMKSCTLEPREGNPHPRYVDLQYGTFNSMGLPNLGYKAYVKFSKIISEKYNKPVITSVCGMTIDDNIKIFKAFNDSPVSFIELNPGSPNTIGKPIIGYDTLAMEKLLNAVSKVSKKPFGVKLPPYFDLVHFEEMAKVIKKYPVKFVTCVNAFGNALAIDYKKETVLIKPKGGLGGLGGSYIKFNALANVRNFFQLFEDKIEVVGVGGVYSGIDAFEYILAGASAVQVGSAYMQKGPGIFKKIQHELSKIMDGKGYKKISDFRGRLKTLD